MLNCTLLIIQLIIIIIIIIRFVKRQNVKRLPWCYWLLPHNVAWLTVCPARCSMIGRACDRQLTVAANQWRCCHQECLAGCYGPLDIHCISCVHVTYSGRCLRKCPHGTYQVCRTIACRDQNKREK